MYAISCNESAHPGWTGWPTIAFIMIFGLITHWICVCPIGKIWIVGQPVKNVVSGLWHNPPWPLLLCSYLLCNNLLVYIPHCFGKITVWTETISPEKFFQIWELCSDCQAADTNIRQAICRFWDGTRKGFLTYFLGTPLLWRNVRDEHYLVLELTALPNKSFFWDRTKCVIRVESCHFKGGSIGAD